MPQPSGHALTPLRLRRAAAVLLSMFRLSAATGETELAQTLGQDPATVRGYLRLLCRLGWATRRRSHCGFSLTPAAMDRLAPIAGQPGSGADRQVEAQIAVLLRSVQEGGGLLRPADSPRESPPSRAQPPIHPPASPTIGPRDPSESQEDGRRVARKSPPPAAALVDKSVENTVENRPGGPPDATGESAGGRWTPPGNGSSAQHNTGTASRSGGKARKTALRKREIPRALSTAAESLNRSKPFKTATVAESPPEAAVSAAAAANYAALHAYGVGDNARVRALCAREDIDPDTIHRQAMRLKSRGRLSPSLLIYVVEAGDPVERSTEEDDRRRYAEWGR